jgi:predicted nucleic acid-binding protein
MDYVADTVAIVRHLRQKRLGKQTARIFREADAGQHTIAISSITLMEILYLSEAKRIDVRLPDYQSDLGQHQLCHRAYRR